nr:M14 family zinc carboxypeptidase [Acidovorax sp. 56]
MPESPEPSGRWRLHALTATIISAALLAACSSTPLPPWPSAGSKPTATVPAPLPRAASAKQVPPPLGTTPKAAEATATPVLPTPALVGRNEEPLTPPYSAAVAARFPDPAIQYSTPGLGKDRRSFTTNAELAQWLTGLADMRSGTTPPPQLLQLGVSQRGTPILGLLLTKAKNPSPATLETAGRPTVIMLGQQHGDEPAGAEALLIMARELAPNGLLDALLDKINVIVVPRANPDGAEAGTRNTANGVDMNRDHLLLQTPEAQAIARLVRDYRPLLVIDSHEYTVAGRFKDKFNAIQKYDALLQHATTANYPEFLTKASLEWYHAPMVAALKEQGLSSEWYYTTSTDREDKSISMGGTQPDTGRNVHGLKNAVSLLIETRGVGIGRLHAQRRVHTQVTAITSALRSTADKVGPLEQVRSFVARDTAAQACRDQVVTEAAATPTQRDLILLDPTTGEDRSLRVDWNSSLSLRKLQTRARPCGYWLDASATAAVERLKLMGVQVMKVAEAGSLLAEKYQETAREIGERRDVRGAIAASSDTIRIKVAPVRAAIDVPTGSYYIPLNQALAHVAVAALEPDTQSSYFANHLIGELEHTARVMATPSLVFEEAD